MISVKAKFITRNTHPQARYFTTSVCIFSPGAYLLVCLTKKKRITVGGVHTLHAELDNVAPFLSKVAWYRLDEVSPVIENWFNRITLVNYGKTERLTIDFNLRFHHLKSDGWHKLERVAIIELKRDGNVPSPALDLLRETRIKRSGFSKYCIGSALTHNSLKRNNFKERLTMINKMEKQTIK